MLLVVCAALACGCCWPSARPDDAFPETMVFEGLGLPDALRPWNGSAAAAAAAGEHPGDDAAAAIAVAAAGDLNDALTTMNFHRGKMNDYLCRQYVVETILQEISTNPAAASESRSILSEDGHGKTKTLAMRTDQGSSSYSAWLAKTKLMKRIYDEYDLDVKMYEKPVGFKLGMKINGSLKTRDRDPETHALDAANNGKKPPHLPHGDSLPNPSEQVVVDIAPSQSVHYDVEGKVGYNYRPEPTPDFGPTQEPPPSYGPPPPMSYGPPTLSESPPPMPPYGPPQPAYGYPYVQPPAYYGPPNQQPPTTTTDPELTTKEVETLNDSENETNSDDADDPTNRSGLTASDLYDLTLTAIAFLGFGTFVMNLIMDAMAVQQSGATLVMNSSPLLGAASSRDGGHAKPVIWEEIEELSWTVVSTIDNVIAEVDGTPVDCDGIKRLCQRSERLVRTGTNFSSKLLPVWNVALGWLSKKLGKDTGQPVISALLGHCTIHSQCRRSNL